MSTTNSAPDQQYTEYSSDNDLAREVCKAFGVDPSIHFVEARKRNGIISVRGTCGKLDEFRWLRKRCYDHGGYDFDAEQAAWIDKEILPNTFCGSDGGDKQYIPYDELIFSYK